METRLTKLTKTKKELCQVIKFIIRTLWEKLKIQSIGVDGKYFRKNVYKGTVVSIVVGNYLSIIYRELNGGDILKPQNPQQFI